MGFTLKSISFSHNEEIVTRATLVDLLSREADQFISTQRRARQSREQCRVHLADQPLPIRCLADLAHLFWLDPGPGMPLQPLAQCSDLDAWYQAKLESNLCGEQPTPCRFFDHALDGGQHAIDR